MLSQSAILVLDLIQLDLAIQLRCFNVGLDHLAFGVGRGLHSSYMVDKFPDFAKDSGEVKRWTEDVLQKGFLAFEYPVLNEFAAILAWFGLIGEIFVYYSNYIYIVQII